MLNLLADVFLLATGLNRQPPARRAGDWNDRFVPRRVQGDDPAAYRWFNPGRDQVQ